MNDTPHHAAWLASAAEAARLTLHVQSPARLQQNLSRWLAQELSRIHDPGFGERFAAGCPVPGAAPADYQQRALELPGFGPSLAGIRFLGGDTTQPFVDLLAWSAMPDDLSAGLAALGEAFAVFSPPRARLLLSGPPPGGEPDQYWVAGRLPALRAPVALDVEPGGPEDAPQVAAAYARAWALTPALRPHLSASTADDLAGCDAVVRLRVGGQWAGLAAARRAQDWALDGFEIVEEILAPDFRGRGLGPVLQRALIAALPASADAPVFGTIHADNAPSLATARRCGRAVVGGWWFVPTGR